MKEKSHHTRAFLNERTILKVDEYTSKGELYKAFVEYCREKELPTLPYTKFVSKLLKNNPELQHTQRKINDKYYMCWLGIKLKTPSPF